MRSLGDRQRTRGAAMYGGNDFLGVQGVLGLYPGTFLWAKYAAEAPDTVSGMDAQGRLPEDGDLSVGIMLLHSTCKVREMAGNR